MSSRNQNSKSTKKSAESGEKKHEDKSNSQKEAYKKKNYKSSPALSPSASEKVVLFQCKASSKTSGHSDASSSGNSNTRPIKGNSAVNSQPCKSDDKLGDNSYSSPMQKKHFLSGSISNVVPPFDKNHKRKQPNVPLLVSPQFTSMAPQYRPKPYVASKQMQNPEKFHHGNPLNVHCAKPIQPGNYRFTRPQVNFRHPMFHQNAQNARLGNQGNRGFQNNFVTNQTPPLMYKQATLNTQKKFPVNFVHNRPPQPNTCIKDPKWNVPIVKDISTPAIKYKKKKSDSKNSNSNSGKKIKTHPNWKTKKRNNIRLDKKEPSNSNAPPLLSFKFVNEVPEKSLDLIHFSDDDVDDEGSINFEQSVDNLTNLIDFSDDVSVISQDSIDYTTNLIDLSDISVPFHSDTNTTRIISDSETDSDSSSESEESEINSEISVGSSIQSSESRINIFKRNLTKESFVSVFWDIENCALPSKQSVVEFASYVRGTFYEGRTEAQFITACDVSNLSSVVVKELDEAAITLIHISSVSKNAADKKIQSLLQRFQLQYRNTNSAIVLISSDSDFSPILVDMRYQHHIFINLICKSNTRDSLTTAANNFVFFDDIIKKLPDRDTKNEMQHILLITNLPQMNCKLIKSSLSEKLISLNCRINVNTSRAKIVFKDHSVCLKAMNSLKGYYLGGNALDITYQKEVSEIATVSKKKKKVKNNSHLPNKILKKLSVSEKTSKSERDGDLNSSNGASLSIFVSTYLGNVEYWKKAFETSWKTTEFLVHWEGTILDGFLLVNFKSLRKAQKAKKILVKNQMNDSDAPKFLKLIKYGEELGSLIGNMNSIEDLSKKKIDEFLEIIEKKKNKFLKKHESIMKEMHHSTKLKAQGATEAITDKLRELDEQMLTFINFSNITVNIVKSLCYSENLELKLKELLCDFTRECNCFSSALPIYAKKDVILKGIRNHQVVIIRAETGSGKSTQLTQYMWREKSACRDGKIICTQPRKIAAISLAKYVSSQIGSRVGDVVGYQVGMSSKLSQNTKIMYVTDFTMLKMLVSEDLSDICCVIIDEAHERTIYTDILIGMIKQSLSKYPHLRIIITSATIDTSIFQDYFTLTDSSVLHISGRTFPVEDIWLNHDVTPDWDYFNKTIDKSLEILTEDPGDVLAFLTTPLETEKAFEKFSVKLKGKIEEKKIKAFYLHGKMNSEEQQKVFEKTPSGMRKVIFATNCAETSITIPGIKYVIDCGLVKESQYDAIRNMNVLSVGFVSKSSAEQRRGRAGRTQIGKCYHLYSKKNYDNMVNNTDPEILRINLGQALMKLMKMGVGNPLQFDFLQSPPRQQLTSAMDQLLYLKAVEENSTLTDLGNKMAVLPLEPRLCHLILQGFDDNIGYDSLVAAALTTMSHTIFFRNSENKDEADKKKRRFCESENDFISYLEVYKEWADVPKNLKSQWCVNNYINARSMRTVHELVNEIILILQKELQFKVKPKFNSEEPYDALKKAIFYSFSQNLSVFSGHSKFGYKRLDIFDRLLIHPSSSTCTFGQSTPQFVVYDSILKTSQTFMINVSPVTKDMIKDAVKLHNLKIDLMDFENLIGSELSIDNLGEKILINNFIGKKGLKRKDLLRRIKECIDSDFVEIDIDVPKGSVKIFAFSNKLEEVKSVVFPIINDAQQILLREEKEVYLFEDRQFSVVLAAGGFIHDAILPGEFKDIRVNLKETGDIESVIEKLSLCGDITETREWKKYFKVTFKTPTAAKKALHTYSSEKDFSLQSIHAYLPMHKDHLYKVHISFFRRPCVGLAYISVDQQIPSLLLPSFVTYNGVIARVSVNKKTGDLRIMDLPLNTEKKILESEVALRLPSNIKITKCIVNRKKAYESTKEEMELIKSNIYNLFSEFTFKANIEVNLKKPTAVDFAWNATVFIKSSQDGEAAVNALKYRKNVPNFLGGFILKPELQTRLCCKSEIFSVVKDEIEEALQFFKGNQKVGNELSINAVPKFTDSVEIKIQSNNVSDITDARKFIHRILSGDTLNFASSNKEKLFSKLGRELMKKLSMDYQDCFILQNNYTKTITIFGKETSSNKIKMCINDFLIKLENDDCKDLSLKMDSGKSIFKELLKRYGYDFQKLQEECNISDIKFNKPEQILTVQGSSSSVSKCESIIQDIKKSMEVDFSEVNGEVCPVCYDEVSENKHRLQYCGHAYCSECLLHLFQNSEDIPLKCEVCEDPIVLSDIFWAVNRRKPLQQVLFKKFLHSFVANGSDISFCPSPDCKMIFRVTEESNIFECPVCGNNICTKCEELHHYGMSCCMYKCLKNDGDYSLKVWMQEDPQNRKTCPSCNSPIEKNGGCLHMTCWQCKCHMCWLCLQVFPNGDEVYQHQLICPGEQA